MPSISLFFRGRKYIKGANLAVTALGATLGLVASFCLSSAQAQTAYSVISTGTPSANRTFYVSSQTRFDPANDGSSWQKAWTNTNQINWSSINPGDTITYDGGRYGLYYAGTLTIGKSGSYSAPIKIVTSSEPGRDGTVTLMTTSAAPSYTGIDFGNTQYVRVEGRKTGAAAYPTKSLRIYGFVNYGVKIGPTSYMDTLKNVEVLANGYGYTGGPQNACGILVQGRVPTIESCLISNNKVNVIVESQYGGYGPTFNKCAIFNSPAAAAAGPSTSPPFQFSWDETDGVRIRDTYRGGFSWFNFYDCVFGPGLGTGIEFGQKNGGLNANNCLFINPKTVAVKKVATTLPDSQYSIISLRNITTFLTPLNRDNLSHSNLDFTEGQDSVYNSIFWGGTVRVVGTRTLGSGNFQNRTTGNTLVLSPNQTDPGFQANVSTITANDWERLFFTDFNLRAGAPATGKGSRVTSLIQGMGL